jgi:hypothetical protein
VLGTAADYVKAIKITENKAIFIKAKHRQEVLFKRHLINTSANN